MTSIRAIYLLGGVPDFPECIFALTKSKLNAPVLKDIKTFFPDRSDENLVALTLSTVNKLRFCEWAFTGRQKSTCP